MNSFRLNFLESGLISSKESRTGSSTQYETYHDLLTWKGLRYDEVDNNPPAMTVCHLVP